MSSDAFEVVWTGPAQRAVRRLPEKVATAAIEFIYGSLARNPQRAGKPLRLHLAGLHSGRQGDYRVIYRIDEITKRVEVLAIEHRGDAYLSR